MAKGYRLAASASAFVLKSAFTNGCFPRSSTGSRFESSHDRHAVIVLIDVSLIPVILSVFERVSLAGVLVNIRITHKVNELTRLFIKKSQVI